MVYPSLLSAATLSCSQPAAHNQPVSVIFKGEHDMSQSTPGHTVGLAGNRDVCRVEAGLLDAHNVLPCSGQ